MRSYLRLFFPIIIITAASSISNAQQNVGPADSLKKRLQQTISEDSNKVWLLMRLANATFTDKPDEAMDYAEKSIALAEKIKWQKGIALSYKVKGGLYYARNDFLKSLEYSQQALTYAANESLVIRVGILHNIANVYQDMQEYEKAISIFREYRTVTKELNIKDEEAMAVYGIGTSYHSLKKYDSAVVLLNECIGLTRQAGNKRTESTVLCALSVTYREMGNNKESGEYAEKSIKLAKESGNFYVLSPALNNLSTALILQGKYNEAEQYSKESLAVARQIKSVQWEYQAWDELYQIFEKQGKTAQAFDAYKQFIVLRDSVLNDEKRQEITRKEIQYEAEKKEVILNAAHSAQLLQQKTVRNAIAAGAGILLVGGLFSFILYKRRKDALTKQKEAELKSEISDTEMKALRAQMNPHFIFNSLNSISDYIAKNNTKVADEYLTKFAKLMRLILENSEQKQVPLAKDIKALELYMQLESLRMNNKFTYDINIDDGLDPESTLVPPLILQPFVENSIWHGIANKNGDGKIIISILKSGDSINYIVQDNGIGRKAASLLLNTNKDQTQKSLGMKITKERIDLLNKLKNSTAAIRLTDMEDGTKIEIKLPLQLNF